MTATHPPRAEQILRGVCYGFDLLDHASVMADAPRVEFDDYVGKTRQWGRRRENQHRDDKPWEDLIVGSAHKLWEGDCIEDDLDVEERRLIREKCPRMNDKDNRWNPDRIEYEDQVRQRHERDAKWGKEPWQPPEKRSRQSLLDWPTSARPLPSEPVAAAVSTWTFDPWEIKVALWVVGWLSATCLVWGCLAHMGAPWDVAGWVAGIVCALALAIAVVVPGRKPAKKRHRR